jgi:3-isopropylmalate dehydratase small subunit
LIDIQTILTSFRAIFKQNQSKVGNILRGITQLNFDKKANLDFDRKKSNLDVDKKNAQLRVEKKKKKEHFTEHRTYANPPPKAHTQKPNSGGYA